MVVRALIAGLLVSLCVAIDIQFPETDPCILIELDSNNSLSWNENGTKMSIPNWNISGFDVVDGNCTTAVHFLTIRFEEDNATMRFDFQNSSGKVDLKMRLDFVPEKVFRKLNNTDNSTVSIKTDVLKTGGMGKAFKCNSETDLKGNQSAGADEYDLTLRISNLKVQAFGVKNGNFSDDFDECAADHPTTAPAPNTTVTTPPVTPTISPKTPPKVTLNATDGNETCAMIVGKLTLMIPYPTNKTKKTATVNVPDNVKTSGKCVNANKTDILMATFGDGWELDFVFKGDGDNIWWEHLNVTVQYDESLFPDIMKNMSGTNQTFSTNFTKAFKAKKDGSYLCNSATTTDLGNGLQLKTSDLQYTALQKNVTSFSDKNIAECSADAKTSSIVPIAVGAALAGLVVIVLIAYLIGRRRNRKGYESV